MDKRRKKGKFKLDEPKSPVMKRHTRLIDLFKKSPINMESLVKLSRRIERKERKMEKEKKKEEIYLKIREVVEDSTSNVKKESEGIQKDLEKEELKEEEEIPLKRRTKEKEQEIRRERRSKSHPIESNPLSVGVLQLPNRSYSDQEATSKMASQGIREEFEDLITKQKTKSYQDTTQIEQQEKEIEKISTDESINIYKKENIDSSNIKLWDWEGIDCSYQADSSSSQTSPLNRGQPSASCEIIEEPEEEEKIVKHNISSPWFSEEEYLEKIENLESNEDKNKEKKSTKILKRCKKQLRKLTPNKLKHSIRRTVSDIIHKKTKPIIV